MKKLSLLLAAAFALAATGGTADAKKRHKVAPHAQYEQGYWEDGSYRPWGPSWGTSWAYGPHGNDYSGRHDPSTWSGPLNAWDKARRDDSFLMRR